jgi:cyclopropane fatty-acyl-phospholipid synthase-like methyltransferase
MGNGKTKKRKKKGSRKETLDRHLLYSAAVQSPEVDLDFFERVYKKTNGTTFRTLREDFCGTAVLACEWVKRREANRALGVDLDEATLDWGRRRYFPVLGEAADRIELRCADVREVTEPEVEVVAAQNFSYSVFKTRDELRGYLTAVRRSLTDGGLIFMDLFGGTDAICEAVEKRRIDASTAFNGTRVPSFTYTWDQARFNPVDHATTCYIHFKLKSGKKLKRAFRYDWRLWTIPELRELLDEAGFSSSDVYVEGWDDEADDTDGVFRKRRYFENMSGWVAYVVGTA